jgi:hypothetical protein
MPARPRSPGHGASLSVWAKRARWRKWRSRIYLDGRNVHLGYFDTLEQARAAHAAAVKAHLGEQFLKGARVPGRGKYNNGMQKPDSGLTSFVGSTAKASGQGNRHTGRLVKPESGLTSFVAATVKATGRAATVKATGRAATVKATGRAATVKATGRAGIKEPESGSLKSEDCPA